MAAFLVLPFSFLTGTPPTEILCFKTWSSTCPARSDDLPLLEIAREKPQSRPETQTGTLAATRSRRVSPAPAYLHRSRAPHASPANANQSQSALRAAQAASELAQYRAIRASSGTGQAAPANQRKKMLKKLRPKEKRQATTTAAPPVDIPNMEQHVADMNLPARRADPRAPKLELNAGAAPRVAQKNAVRRCRPRAGSWRKRS